MSGIGLDDGWWPQQTLGIWMVMGQCPPALSHHWADTNCWQYRQLHLINTRRRLQPHLFPLGRKLLTEYAAGPSLAETIPKLADNTKLIQKQRIRQTCLLVATWWNHSPGLVPRMCCNCFSWYYHRILPIWYVRFILVFVGHSVRWLMSGLFHAEGPHMLMVYTKTQLISAGRHRFILTQG